MKYLIVGLGNPGPEYADTRHNIGFMVLDALAGASGAVFRDGRYGSFTEVKYAGKLLVLLKPNTFMNLSGKAVRYWMEQEKVPLERVLVITDDIALPTATLRLRAQGSDGGHNGLKSINALVQSQQYPRLRFGVGNNFAKGHQADYVLAPFEQEELHAVQLSIERAVELCKYLPIHGIGATMTKYNKYSTPE